MKININHLNTEGTIEKKIFVICRYIDDVVFKRIEAATSDAEYGLNESEIGEDFVFDMKVRL